MIENAVLIIFGLGFMAMGAVTLIQHYFYSSDYKVTSGKLLKADVIKEKFLWTVTLRPDIEYEFFINGKEHRGNKIYSMTSSSISLFPLWGIDTRIYPIRKLRPENELTIYYNPNNPDESYLKLSGLHCSIVLSIIFLVLGLVIFFSVSISLILNIIKG